VWSRRGGLGRARFASSCRTKAAASRFWNVSASSRSLSCVLVIGCFTWAVAPAPAKRHQDAYSNAIGRPNRELVCGKPLIPRVMAAEDIELRPPERAMCIFLQLPGVSLPGCVSGNPGPLWDALSQTESHVLPRRNPTFVCKPGYSLGFVPQCRMAKIWRNSCSWRSAAA
jgi:hypothetical protein